MLSWKSPLGHASTSGLIIGGALLQFNCKIEYLKSTNSSSTADLFWRWFIAPCMFPRNPTPQDFAEMMGKFKRAADFFFRKGAAPSLCINMMHTAFFSLFQSSA
jgi:hypothetical protein